MNIGIISALLSSFCLAIMIIYDRLMMTDCYEKSPDRAWIISSLFGSIFGLVATISSWIIFAYTTTATLNEIFSLSAKLFLPHGALIMLGGIVTIQVMRHYFRLFIPDKAGKVNEVAIAMWLSSVPIFIFIALTILNLLGFSSPLLGGLENANLTLTFGTAVLLTVITIIGFEYVSSDHFVFRLEHFSEVIKMISCIVIYSILIGGILGTFEDSLISALALQPFYWIGFGAGTRILLFKKTRSDFSKGLQTIRKFLPLIITVELIGMAVYYFEFFGLHTTDPTLVNLVVGSHMIFVFLLSYAIRSLKAYMGKNSLEKVTFGPISITYKNLPSDSITHLQVFWFVLVIGTLLYALAQV